MSAWTMHHGDCLEWLTTLPDKSVDAVVSDPPDPEISRDYGRLTEGEWHTLMRGVVEQSRRVLKPHGSAVFILQPNSERVGRMRPWLWEFMAWTAREWNMVQDAWWWNTSAPPTVHVHRKNGLMRPSVKACVWLGEPDCLRNQDAVLWTETDALQHPPHRQCELEFFRRFGRPWCRHAVPALSLVGAVPVQARRPHPRPLRRQRHHGCRGPPSRSPFRRGRAGRHPLRHRVRTPHR